MPQLRTIIDRIAVLHSQEMSLAHERALESSDRNDASNDGNDDDDNDHDNDDDAVRRPGARGASATSDAAGRV